MVRFNYEEAIYGALCYTYGNDDNKITTEEFKGINPRFLERHYLSPEAMDIISTRWTFGPEEFYQDIVDSLNQYSYVNKIEAIRTLCIIKNDFSEKRDDRWNPLTRILNGIGVSWDEYNAHVK